MSSNKIREQLELRPVGIEYLDQFNELLRYVFQVTNQDLATIGYEDGEMMKAKHPVMTKADVLGWFNHDQLVSQLCIYPCVVNIHGKLFKMGGLTGVGTYPEYSNMGLMNELIKVGLKKMRDKGQWISFLYPYSVPYYRKKGWELMSEHLSFTIKDSQVPRYEEMPGRVERLPVGNGDVLETYDRYARTNHGAMIREKLEWEEYWRWDNEDEYTAAVYYNSADHAMGYTLYRIADDVFHIKEMIYLTQEARRGLWNFISAHFSMIDQVKGNVFRNEPIAFQLPDSQIVETIEPYFMARIVDVQAFLTNYPFQATGKPFHLEVTDPMAEWNQGVFGLSWDKDGALTVSHDKVGPSVKLNIQTLTAMLMSFRSPAYFHRIEYLQTDADTLSVLEEIIPEEQPYFSDYF